MMSVIVDEVGAIAADSVSTILEQSADGAWAKLVAGGWAGLGADPEADLAVRDILEIARIAGRSATPTPLVTTLLAGRWFRPENGTLETGVAFAVPRGDQVVVPYATPGATVLDAQGGRVPSGDSRTEDFSDVMPLAVLSAPAAVDWSDQHVAELHAVLAAVTVGCTDAVVERSVAWVQTRQQFGRTISSFQAVRHHLANMHIAREQAWTAAIAAAHEPGQATAWSRQACELSITAIETGIQVHGGVGFTAEVGLQLFLDHVLQIQSLLGARP